MTTDDSRARWAADIRAARARSDITQEALAKLAGVTRQTIGAIEKGEGNRATFLAVASALGIDLLADFRETEPT